MVTTRRRKLTEPAASDGEEQLTLPENAWQTKPDDGTLEFFAKPHTLLILGMALLALIYLAYYGPRGDMVANTKRGIIFAILAFLLFAITHFHNGPFLRPHPAFWRVIVGLNVIYLMALVVLLFQDLGDARRLFKYLYPDLGQPLPEKAYAVDCRIYTPENPHSNFANVVDTIYDEFFIAHILGWFGKAIMYRDFYVTMACSLFFEVLEFTFEHVLPNFRECWWDHLLLDVLGCNILGIVIGWWTCRFFAMKNYNWVGFKKIRGVKGKVKRAVLQLTPMSWERYRWEAAHDFRRFGSALFVVICTGFIDINAFFLKTVLWIPSTNMLNTYRLFLWFFIGLQALREFYQFVVDRRITKLGTQAWLSLFTIFIEALIWFKFSLDIPGFWVPFPPHIVWGWTISVTGLVLWCVWRFWLRPNRESAKSE